MPPIGTTTIAITKNPGANVDSVETLSVRDVFTAAALDGPLPAHNREDIIAGMTTSQSSMARTLAEAEDQVTLHDRSRVLEQLTDGFLALDLAWRFTYLNPAAEAMFHRSQQELLGKSIWQELPAAVETALYPAFQRAMALGEAVDVDIFYAPFNRWFDVRAFPSPRGLSVSLHDVSKWKLLEQELRNALADANTAHRATSEFLAMMSHELRTPMQAVLGYADLLIAGTENTLTADQIEDVRCIQQGGKRMIALIDQMLELSRLQAGRLDLTIEEVDLRMVIDQVRQDIVPLAAAKGLDLSFDVPPSLPLVQGDSARLRQILLNLAANAVKFTARGWVRIGARLTPEHIEIAVSDTGIGIPEQALGHIFEEFRQADSSTTRRFGGAGLGLAIARKLAEQQGGHISVVSKPNVGSTFTLHLAAKAISRSPQGTRLAKAPRQRRVASQGRVTAQAV